MNSNSVENLRRALCLLVMHVALEANRWLKTDDSNLQHVLRYCQAFACGLSAVCLLAILLCGSA